MRDDVGWVGDLEIEQDIRIQHTAWRFQRIGWGIWAAIALAAMLGLTGRGPLSHTTAGEEGGPIRLEYDRYERLQTPSTLRVRLGPNASGSRKTRIWVSRDYMDSLEAGEFQPEPEETEARPDRFVYVFNTPDPDRPTSVTFSFKPERIGPLAGGVGLEGGPAHRFHQFVYP